MRLQQHCSSWLSGGCSWLISETSGISKFFGDLVSKLLDWDPVSVTRGLHRVDYTVLTGGCQETRLDVVELCEILDQATITPKGAAVSAVSICVCNGGC